jgi:integron integrase
MSRLLSEARAAARVRRYDRRTEVAYVRWIRRYVHFCGLRHPSECGAQQVEAFLAHLTREGLSPSTRRQALAAVRFLYRRVLRLPLAIAARASPERPPRTPRVLQPSEVERVLARLPRHMRLPVMLMYGAGMRLSEIVALRVRDVDVRRHTITVRAADGKRAREISLPSVLGAAVAGQIEAIRARHQAEAVRGGAYIPLGKGYVRDWRWTWLFPSPRTAHHVRRHVHETSVQRAVVRAAALAGLAGRVTPHAFRHSHATYLLQTGHRLRTVQQLLGHRDVTTTAVYLPLVARGAGVRSPLDHLRLPAYALA